MEAKISEASRKLLELSDAQLKSLAFVPWQYGGISTSAGAERDVDGAPVSAVKSEPESRESLQQLCWTKFFESPQVNTSIRGMTGRLTGMGFEIFSEEFEIQKVVEETEEDPRNRLYSFWPKFVARSKMEGELFLALTCHDDGFIEVDFVDPASISGGSENDGIVMHPKKHMPLVYLLKNEDGVTEMIPSVFVARYPELLGVALEADPTVKLAKMPRSRKKAFTSVGGFNKFIVAWDQGFITRRNVSYLKTILNWLNYYELLKRYEIDHKRAAASYLWIFTIEDTTAFRLWLGLTDEEKRKTGIGAKRTPGSSLVLPPGMDVKAINPNLPRISDSDSDILHMVTSGLNEPEDVTTGQSKGTFASVKASRGPMSDRISDEVAYFERFIRFDFFGSIFFLKSKIAGFPETFKINKVVGFKNKKPIKKDVEFKPEKLLEISFPKTEMVDVETRARAYLGVKHGSTNQVLGISNKKIAREMGIGNYHQMRLDAANEEEKYPELLIAEDDEAFQEKTVAEPAHAKKSKPKPEEKP
jgi:hypothetical protein